MRRYTQIFFIIALLVSSVAVSPGGSIQGKTAELKSAAQVSPQPPGTQVFMPIVIHDPGYTVSGKVSDGGGQPVANVNIVDQRGRSVTTDAGGNYSITGLPKNGALAPSKSGMVFSPSLAQLNLLSGNLPLNFNAYQQCPDFVLNGSYEASDSWQQPITEYTAGYTTSAAHTGTRSMRTGITDASQNKYSYSSTRQPIRIPAGTTSAILRLWLYPISSDTSTLAMPSLPTGVEMDNEALGSDGQYVLVVDPENDPYDPDTGILLETLLWMRSNDQQWGLYEFNLSKYASSTQDVWIKVQAGTYNDGVGGVTSMYVDDVSLELCGAGAAPQPPTQPAQGACSNGFINSDFLAGRSWLEHPGDGVHGALLLYTEPFYSPVVAHGHRRCRQEYLQLLGRLAGGNHTQQRHQRHTEYVDLSEQHTDHERAAGCIRRSFGSGAASRGAIRRCSLWRRICSTSCCWTRGAVSSRRLWWERWNTNAWTQLSFDLTAYAGRSMRIQFGTYNDGFGSASPRCMWTIPPWISAPAELCPVQPRHPLRLQCQRPHRFLSLRLSLAPARRAS